MKSDHKNSLKLESIFSSDEALEEMIDALQELGERDFCEKFIKHLGDDKKIKKVLRKINRRASLGLDENKLFIEQAAAMGAVAPTARTAPVQPQPTQRQTFGVPGRDGQALTFSSSTAQLTPQQQAARHAMLLRRPQSAIEMSSQRAQGLRQAGVVTDTRRLPSAVGTLLLDIGQTALDIIGAIPPLEAVGIAEIADFSNASISLLRTVSNTSFTNILNAIVSLVSIVPTAGDAIGKGYKWLRAIEAIAGPAVRDVSMWQRIMRYTSRISPRVARIIQQGMNKIRTALNFVNTFNLIAVFKNIKRYVQNGTVRNITNIIRQASNPIEKAFFNVIDSNEQLKNFFFSELGERALDVFDSVANQMISDLTGMTQVVDAIVNYSESDSQDSDTPMVTEHIEKIINKNKSIYFLKKIY